MEKVQNEWTNQKAGVEIRAVLTEDVPYEASAGSGTEVADLWILFLSIIGNDYWIAYGIVDTLEGEPQDSLDESNLTELKKLSIVIGDHWSKIEKFALDTSKRHRALAHDTGVVNSIIMEMSFTELQERRDLIDWEGTRNHWKQFPMTLSLN